MRAGITTVLGLCLFSATAPARAAVVEDDAELRLATARALLTAYTRSTVEGCQEDLCVSVDDSQVATPDDLVDATMFSVCEATGFRDGSPELSSCQVMSGHVNCDPANFQCGCTWSGCITLDFAVQCTFFGATDIDCIANEDGGLSCSCKQEDPGSGPGQPNS